METDSKAVFGEELQGVKGEFAFFFFIFKREHAIYIVRKVIQATSYTGSESTGNQLYRQRKHRQPVEHAAQKPVTIKNVVAAWLRTQYVEIKAVFALRV